MGNVHLAIPSLITVVGGSGEYEKVGLSFSEVIAPQSVKSGAVMPLNKALVVGKERHIRVGGLNPTIYMFKKDNVLSPTANYLVTVNNKGAEFDLDDSTKASYSTDTTGVTDIAEYDFGSVAERFVYARIGADQTSIYCRIWRSDDGSSWYNLFETNSGAKSFFAKTSFRYLKWSMKVSSGSGASYLYSLEVFDPANYAKKIEQAEDVGDYVIDENELIWVVIDSANPYVYYIYDLDKVKISIDKGRFSKVIP